ncbi:MAG TPA: phosphohydrolase [Saprospirales bacterium]|nr:phosphohydrolase [Saprospirales bacterium]
MISKSNIALILSAFRERGHEEYHGEPVSQLEHAIQAAELARIKFPDDPEFIIAAFLHDFGHLCESSNGDMDGFGKWDHEAIGAQQLKSLGLSPKITSLVANHVMAKRYLVSTDPLYFAGLSEASKITLEKQGGLLTPEEQSDFEADPLFHLHISLRRIDEQAKATGLPVDTLWVETLIHQYC